MWRPRLPDLRERAMCLGCDSACTIFTDAAGTRGEGAALGDSFLRGSRPKPALREGINRKELGVLG